MKILNYYGFNIQACYGELTNIKKNTDVLLPIIEEKTWMQRNQRRSHSYNAALHIND
ncbi:hypothetical protein SAMN02910353_02849 [Ruminococcus sp. YRD2003]|uniref:hypothetical protein n=1 Tax=Ruminococcus sp. YRD2003 TaxID=1452313 RepID=UPI0008B43676|nr:hypothetical protein SAMN02910353_02849 [Ruminococcus flavefaciens]